METISTIPIVLTATILPNEVQNAVSDPEIRKTEYLRALEFYSRFTNRVFFLENSAYRVEQNVIEPWPNVQLQKLPPSSNPARGKGYQEFEMLDAWISGTSGLPPRWLKISGRYIVRNIENILQECSAEVDCSLIIDQSRRAATARTQVFFVTSEYYRKTFMNLYKQCDDPTGRWIERVLFQALRKTENGSYRFFRCRPQFAARSATTGRDYPSSRLGNAVKNALRAGNRLFDDKYLWFSR
jgi:hypothetical protein